MSELGEVRRFAPGEWALYRWVRLRALSADPGVFASNLAREAAHPDARWQARLVEPAFAAFAVRHPDGPPERDRVVGMTAIAIDAEDPTQAGLIASWLEPAFRRRGLSDAMYAARIAWARAQPGLERLTVSHRASNLASMRANQRHGFVLGRETERRWPDGVVERELHYTLRL